MQKRLVVLSILLLLFAPGILPAQSECNLHLSSDFDSDCILTGYSNGHIYNLDPAIEDCFQACKGDSVCYTATCDSAISYTWNIMGATTYSFTNQNRTAVVTWGNGETGQVVVTVVTSDGSTCTAEACVRLIESPQIGIATVPSFYIDGNGENVIEICRGETIELTDMSSAGEIPLTGCLWRTPMGFFSTPTCIITAPQSGEFDIGHEIQNDCGCKATEKFLVRVVEPATLRLSCYGTVCEGTTASYVAVSPDCIQYMWHVEGGTYEMGNHSRQITVHWASPPSGYGVITLDGNFCNAQLSVKIPVITDNTEIGGPDVVCVGDIQKFELPLWGATEYQWYTSNNNGIQLLHTEVPNKMLARFTMPGLYVISAAYECEALECGPFRSAKAITVKDTLRIVSDNDNLCIGGEGKYTTYFGENVLWKILKQNGQIICSVMTDTLAYAFTNSGKYKIVASGTDYCNEAEFWVTVMDNPPALTSTDGPHEACLNSAIPLSGNPTHPRYYLEWVPVCDPTNTEEGNTVTIHFNEDEGICDVAVYQVDNEYGCRSAAYIHAVDTFQLLPNGLPAITHVCPGDYTYFEVPDQSDNVLYEWKMEPVPAATAIEDYHLPHVTIRTNHLADSSSFIVKVFLERKICGLSLPQRDTILLSVNNLPSPSVHYPDTVCLNEVVTFTTSAYPVPGTSTWSFPSKTLQGDTVSYMFSSTGLHPFIYTYLPDSECDPFTFADSVYVVAAPIVSISRHGDTLSVPAQSDVQYLWTYGDDTISTSMSCIIVGNGVYCCRVTSNTPPYCSVIRCYRIGDGISTDSCLVIEFDSALVSCNTAEITAGNPTNATFIWSAEPHVGSCFPDHSSGSTTAFFTTPGCHYVDVRTTLDGQCYEGRKYITIPCVPKIKLTYDCDSERIVVHDISLYADSLIPDRIITLDGNYFTTLYAPDAEAYIPTAGFSEGIYTVGITIPELGCFCSDSIFFENKPHILNIENWANLCAGRPVQLHAYVTGATGWWLWNYGDGSYAIDGTTFHTFEYNEDNDTYLVTVTVKNALGCAFSFSRNFQIAPQNLDGVLSVFGSEVCAGTGRVIRYTQGEYNNSAYYHWFLENEYLYPSETAFDNPQNTVYATGNYKVRVEDSETGCELECMRNVSFLTAPTANITGKTEYCLGDEVKLSGNSGATNTYAWNITGPEPLTFDVANITFTPALSGNYLAVLTVTSQDGCTASDTCNFTVHPQPAAPPVSFIGTPCIHQPPVGVKSDNHQSLLWSNGNHGESAYYYVPGYLTAHYVDDSTGCPSAKTNLFIPPAPDYDALLTGCYRRCPDDLPFYMKLNGFYPDYSGNFQWNWYYNNNIDTSGYSVNSSLPVRHIGTYFMTASYGDNCVSTSPILSIGNATMCTCDSVIITAKNRCEYQHCDLFFRFSLFIRNTSSTQSFCFDQLTAYGGSIQSVASLPVTVAPLSTQIVEVIIRLADFENGHVEFWLTDSQRQCFKRFAEYLGWTDCVNDHGLFTNWSAEFLPSFSSPHQGSYFHVRLGLPAGTTQLLDFWSDPPQILNYSYNDLTGYLDALQMLNYGKLTQLVNSHGDICFHAIACIGNQSLCHVSFCLPAAIIHALVPDAFRQVADSTDIDSTAETARSLPTKTDMPGDKLWLAPNPARDEVAVMRIALEEVAEVTVFTMQGSRVASFRNGCHFNVSGLATASYIVRIVTTEGKVHYLKLVKQ